MRVNDDGGSELTIWAVPALDFLVCGFSNYNCSTG